MCLADCFAARRITSRCCLGIGRRIIRVRFASIAKRSVAIERFENARSVPNAAPTENAKPISSCLDQDDHNSSNDEFIMVLRDAYAGPASMSWASKTGLSVCVDMPKRRSLRPARLVENGGVLAIAGNFCLAVDSPRPTNPDVVHFAENTLLRLRRERRLRFDALLQVLKVAVAMLMSWPLNQASAMSASTYFQMPRFQAHAAVASALR